MNKRIPFKRRKLQLTNYKKRLSLVVSGLPRLVVRVSNKYVRCQFIKYEPDGDLTICAFDSKKLNDYGFNGSKNLQSAYLSGLIIGFKGLKKGVKKAILDMGLRTSIKNSRIYACLKGVIEAGVKVPVGDNVMPSDELIKLKELSDVIKKIKGEFK